MIEDETQSGKAPEWASVTVWRLDANGDRQGYTAKLFWDEYCPNLRDSNAFMWSKMPRNQLAKCAEAAAIRKGFPNELGGVYAPEEFDQADFGKPAPKRADDGHRCPVCAEYGVENGVWDNREDPKRGDRQPLWKCKGDKKCKAVTERGAQWGWGSYDEWPWGTETAALDPESVDFDEVQAGMGGELTGGVVKKYAYLLAGKDVPLAQGLMETAMEAMGHSTEELADLTKEGLSELRIRVFDAAVSALANDADNDADNDGDDAEESFPD
jgi:hypothetical protein